MGCVKARINNFIEEGVKHGVRIGSQNETGKGYKCWLFFAIDIEIL
jgi:hypothetical protein